MPAPASSSLLARVERLALEHRDLKARVAVLEAERASRRGPRDETAAMLILALAEVFGSSVFTALDAVEAPHEQLRGVLRAQGLSTRTAVGQRLRGLRGRTVAGFRLVRVKRTGDGELWTFTSMSMM